MHFPDALSGGAMLGELGSVLLLTRAAALPQPATIPFDDYKYVMRTVHYIGGTGAVSADVRTQVKTALEAPSYLD